MTDEILKEQKQNVASLTIIPSDGGRFEVSVDGKLVFSKLKEGRFPELKEIKEAIS